MYRLSHPHPDLSPYIESYWHVDASPELPFDLSVDVFVDGRADLVFNFGVGYTRSVAGGEARVLRRSNLDAQRLVPIRIVQRGDVRIAGVRFRVGGLMPFVRHSVHDWTGRTVGLTEVFGRSIAPVVEAVRASAGDQAAQAATLDAFFLHRLDLTPGKRTTLALLGDIATARGAMPVEVASERAAVSSRSADRLFRHHVGFGPKAWAQIVRFQHALSALGRVPDRPLSQLAVELGYYDQSHLVREYRRFSGTSPGRHAGYLPVDGPTDFAPNVVRFVQDGGTA